MDHINLEAVVRVLIICSSAIEIDLRASTEFAVRVEVEVILGALVSLPNCIDAILDIILDAEKTRTGPWAVSLVDQHRVQHFRAHSPWQAAYGRRMLSDDSS